MNEPPPTGWFKRCPRWQLGPFQTEWRCLLKRDHAGDCEFDPDRLRKQREQEEQ